MDYSQQATITVKVDINCHDLLKESDIKSLDLNQITIKEVVSVQSLDITATFIG